MKVFISGGCKNGKSTYGERIAKAMAIKDKLYYIATMISSDKEDDIRIKKHQKSRFGMGFETLELKYDIFDNLKEYDKNSSFLLDSTTALFANEMFRNNEIVYDAYEKVSLDLESVLDYFENFVMVADFIYSDAFLYDDLTEQYRKGLAYIDRTVVSKCDIVIEVVFDNIIIHKGEDLLKRLECDIY